MDQNQETELSDFESEGLIDETFNKMLSEKRKERIKHLREEALHTIQVGFSISQFVTYKIY